MRVVLPNLLVVPHRGDLHAGAVQQMSCPGNSQCDGEPGLVARARAEDFRERVLAQTSNPGLVARLAPRLPGEADAARRGRALYAQLEQALGLRTQPLLQVRARGVSGLAQVSCYVRGTLASSHFCMGPAFLGCMLWATGGTPEVLCFFLCTAMSCGCLWQLVTQTAACPVCWTAFCLVHCSYGKNPGAGPGHHTV